MQKRRPQRNRPIPAAQNKGSHKHLEIFMRLCRKHGISWGTASEEEESIVEQLLCPPSLSANITLDDRISSDTIPVALFFFVQIRPRRLYLTLNNGIMT